jgi:outer membrane biosynthesis protein TonB
MRPILRWALPAIAVVPLLSGCAALSAKGKPTDLPALNVPPPPPRLIEAAPEPLPEPVAELPTAPPSTTASRGTTRPPVTRPNPPQPESKPADPKPVEPPPPDPAPVAQPSAIAPAAQLRTPQTADTSNAEKGVRTTLDRARGLLTTVNYGSLNNERKKAYDDSNRFIQQADAALKEGNFVFAQSLAGKAETLAKELAGK